MSKTILEMIDTIGGVVIMVSDQARAVKFYAEKVGFDIRLNVPFFGGKWIEVAPKDSESTLSIMEPNPQLMPPEELEIARKNIGRNTGVWFYTSDIQSTYEDLKSKGVDITKPEKQEWGGIMSLVKDLDGNIFTLLSSPEG
ncbi:MAG: VOC family protein [Nitrososphaeraceae archaeon]|nr:VOC family protein [Nitrososphaeraceae archaeon]MDW0158090.1 VOC family protein [Nitrososphaeraceae archaeon]MDW3654259.1 VOC family protein [Nitrososphaeraceae archaeon]